MAGYRLQVAVYVDMDQQEMIPVMVDSAGRAHPGPTSVLLEMTPDEAETAFLYGQRLDPGLSTGSASAIRKSGRGGRQWDDVVWGNIRMFN